MEIKVIEIIVIPNETHLGIFKKSLRLPVIVHRAIDMIIEAKNSINISFKLHNINMEMNTAEIDNKVVCFKLNI